MLKEYNNKRNFRFTPEPSGNSVKEINSKDIPNINSIDDPRFVIQKHDATHLHYDFRLESKRNGVLTSWAVPKGPSLDPKVKRLAILTEDHPIDYLLFEGYIPKGNYGAGSVIVWDTGTYILEKAQQNKENDQREIKEDVSDQFKKGKINFILFGQRLSGKFSMIKTVKDKQWLLIKLKDEFSIDTSNIKDNKQKDIVKNNSKSILSGLTNNDFKCLKKKQKLKNIRSNKGINIAIESSKNISELNSVADTDNHTISESNIDVNQGSTNLSKIKSSSSTLFTNYSIKSNSHTEKFPDYIQPMLATLVDKPFNSQDWVFEIKWDGVRAILFIHKLKGVVKIQSRNGNTITFRYPELTESLKLISNKNNNFKESIIFDGEIVILNKKGFPDFQKLQERLNTNSQSDIDLLSRNFPSTYYIFDILHKDGFDLKNLALLERRNVLENIIKDKDDNRIKISEFIGSDGEGIFEGIKKMNLEGMIAKHKQSKYYLNTRSREWLKIKNTKTQDCVIIGYTKGIGNRARYFGSLLLAAYVNNMSLSKSNKFKFIGHCGSGFDFAKISSIYNNLEKIKTERCPVEYIPYINRETTWVKPVFVIEVKFNNWTKDKIMRSPIFLRLREDKSPKECIIEENIETPIKIKDDTNAFFEDENKKEIKNKLINTDIDNKNNFTAKENNVPFNKICNNKVNESSSYCNKKLFQSNHQIQPRQQDLKASSFFLKNIYNFSNLDKIYWKETKLQPSITKKRLIEYYYQISSLILPHLKDRPLSLNRYPNGIDGKSFYHKNWQNEKPDYVKSIKIYSESQNKDINYLLCNNKETLLWLVNLGCIEMHPWYSRIKNYKTSDKTDKLKEEDNHGLNYPDFIVFDLDPYIYSGNEDKYQEPEYNLKAFKATVEIAYSLKDIFDRLNIKSFVKTSGKTGLHIFIPIINLYTYEQTKTFAKIIGKILDKVSPNKITTEWDTTIRKDKVFFDYNQNAKGKTIASVFSPRPIESATVSMPINWNDLSNIIPTNFTVLNVVETFKAKEDPWKDILSQQQNLVEILDNISSLSI